MTNAFVLGVGFAALVATVAVSRPERDARAGCAAPAPPLLEESTGILARMPAAFMPNRGQWDHPARFVAKIGEVTAFLEDGGFTVRASPSETKGAAVRLHFLGACAADVVGEEPLAGVHNYFIGSDPSRWQTDVPRFAAVRYGDLFPGVDLRLYERGGHLEYDLVLSPGAVLSAIEVAVAGVDGLRLDADGTLLLETALGLLRQPPPKTFAVDGAGGRIELQARYELRAPDRFGFVVPDWDLQTSLVIDPEILWSTFLGGTGFEEPGSVSSDASGVITVAGVTSSLDYPTTLGAYDTSHNNSGDVFITRLDPSPPSSQQLIYSTFVGGDADERVNGLSVDASGVVTIAGTTTSSNYPTTPGAWDTTHNSPGLADAFITRIDPSTSQQLLYSTFIGGADHEQIVGPSVAPSGVVTIAGQTYSRDFPTTPNAWSRTYHAPTTPIAHGGDAFITRLDPSQPSTQQLLYSTFVGGEREEGVSGLSVDAAGVVTFTGTTNSYTYPTTPGAYDTALNNSGDIFVTRLDPSQPAAQQILYSTFVGGTHWDFAGPMSVDASGVVTIAGATWSTDFPTTPGAWDTSFNSNNPSGLWTDGCVVRLDPSRPTSQQLLYSTFLGGNFYDGPAQLSVDALGVVTIAGYTGSTNFPTTLGAWDRTYNGGQGDAFLTRLDPSRPTPLQQLRYSTFVGGPGDDGFYDFRVDAQGVVTLTGATDSATWPTTAGAWDTTLNGGYDVIVMRFAECVATSYCTAVPNSTGNAASLSVTGSSSIAANGMELSCSALPPFSPGIFFYGGARAILPSGQGTVCVAGTPTQPVVRMATVLMADLFGGVTLPVDFTAPQQSMGASAILPGQTWNFQYWYRDSVGGQPTWNFSNALSIFFCP